MSGHALLGELLQTFPVGEGRGGVPVTVVLDAPWGYALEASTDREHVLIATDNPGGEYWDDLWDLGPTVLIAKQLSPGELLSIINQMAEGKRLRFTPYYETPLTKTEWRVLRLCTTQQDLEGVSEIMQVGSKTLKNHLSSVYGKLGLRRLRHARHPRIYLGLPCRR